MSQEFLRIVHHSFRLQHPSRRSRIGERSVIPTKRIIIDSHHTASALFGVVSYASRGKRGALAFGWVGPLCIPCAIDIGLAPLQPEQSGDENDTPHGHDLRVLVADDNRDSADSVGVVLRLMGFEPTVAYDGDEALRMASALHPRAAILDVGMPRLAGDEVARRLRSEPWAAGILLIALSGWGRDDDRRRSHEAGFDHHLIKPVDFDKLSKLLATIS